MASSPRFGSYAISVGYITIKTAASKPLREAIRLGYSMHYRRLRLAVHARHSDLWLVFHGFVSLGGNASRYAIFIVMYPSRPIQTRFRCASAGTPLRQKR